MSASTALNGRAKSAAGSVAPAAVRLSSRDEPCGLAAEPRLPYDAKVGLGLRGATQEEAWAACRETTAGGRCAGTPYIGPVREYKITTIQHSQVGNDLKTIITGL